MARKSIVLFGMKIAIGLVLLFAIWELFSQFEALTGIMVTGWPRSIIILIFCVMPPLIFFDRYEVRRRAPKASTDRVSQSQPVG